MRSLTLFFFKIIFATWGSLDIPLINFRIFFFCCHKKVFGGTSLAVLWLRLCASTIGGCRFIPGQGTKIPPGLQHDQEVKIKKKKFQSLWYYSGWYSHLNNLKSIHKYRMYSHLLRYHLKYC